MAAHNLYCVLHFIPPCASRNLVTDVKHVEKGIYKHGLSLSDRGFCDQFHRALCLKLEKMVSFSGRSECWVFWLYNKTQIPCLCLTHAHPTENSKSSMWNKSCITGTYFWLKRFVLPVWVLPPTRLVQMTLKPLCLRQLSLGHSKDETWWWWNTEWFNYRTSPLSW